ncbi:MAG: cold shock domain-containing protein [Cyclobacteriaceae bacterium]|nr:cold shock domain-containing protein [Cyclobacteriaceae bacterium]
MAKKKERFNKKELQKKKVQKRKEKEQRREERKANKEDTSFDDMIAYVDEFGNITSTPPEPRKKEEIKLEDIVISTPSQPEITLPKVRTGRVRFFDTSKGFGFILDKTTGEDIFVHSNNLLEEIQEDNIVNFEVEKSPKGLNALEVRLSKE